MNALQDMKDFEKAGFNKEQAEVLAIKLHESITERSATKDDLEKMGLKLESKIDKEIASLKVTMLIWMGAIAAFIIGYLEFFLNRS